MLAVVQTHHHRIADILLLVVVGLAALATYALTDWRRHQR